MFGFTVVSESDATLRPAPFRGKVSESNESRFRQNIAV